MKTINYKYWINKGLKIGKVKIACLIGLLSLLVSFTAFASILFDIEQLNKRNDNNIIIDHHAAEYNQRIEPRFFTNIKNQPNNQKSVPKSISNNYGSNKHQFSKDYEFILFYSYDCVHCKNFIPVLKQYSDNAGIKTKGIVIGGDLLNQATKHFPSFFDPSDKSIIKQEVIERFFGDNKNVIIPTLFILNKRTLHIYPVSQGALTCSELVRRMDVLVPKILNKETIMKHEATTTGTNHV